VFEQYLCPYIGVSNDRKHMDIPVYRRVTGEFQGVVYRHEIFYAALLSDLLPKCHDTALKYSKSFSPNPSFVIVLCNAL
jgi:hypothetical protein